MKKEVRQIDEDGEIGKSDRGKKAEVENRRL